MQDIGFVTLVGSEPTVRDAAIMLASLRTFGGDLSSAPVWVLHTEISLLETMQDFDEHVHQLQIDLRPAPHAIPFGGKVSACARAEELLSGKVHSMVWISPRALIVRPPLDFRLDDAHRAALRPVHIRNIGSLAASDPDPFWQAIYQHLEMPAPEQVVESYVDEQVMYPYFNTHLFAVDPSLGLMKNWMDHFRLLTADETFVKTFCADDLHRIFLHQALFSALVSKQLEWERVRLLPFEYSYPLHLHHEIPLERQAATLNSLICPVYEEPFEIPQTLNGLPVDAPLAGWLGTRSKSLS
jgi:hypothetical protein